MDPESLREEEEEIAEMGDSKVAQRRCLTSKKLEASQEVKELEDALENLGTNNSQVNSILEDAKNRLASISVSEEDEEELTYSQMTERQRSIQHKITTASERLRKLEGVAEEDDEVTDVKGIGEETITDSEDSDIVESQENVSSDSVEEDEDSLEMLDEFENDKEAEDDIETAAEVSVVEDSDLEDSEEAEETVEEETDSNLKPKQKLVKDETLPVSKDVGAGIVTKATKVTDS